MINSETIEKGAYASSIATTLMGLTINEWVAVAGIVCSVGTFIVNWVYKRKYFNLEKRKLDKGISHEKSNH
jgi:uncharacterized membrane protein